MLDKGWYIIVIWVHLPVTCEEKTEIATIIIFNLMYAIPMSLFLFLY